MVLWLMLFMYVSKKERAGETSTFICLGGEGGRERVMEGGKSELDGILSNLGRLGAGRDYLYV